MAGSDWPEASNLTNRPPTLKHTQEIYLARRELLYQRDGGEGWLSSKRFDDALEYFED